MAEVQHITNREVGHRRSEKRSQTWSQAFCNLVMYACFVKTSVLISIFALVGAAACGGSAATANGSAEPAAPPAAPVTQADPTPAAPHGMLTALENGDRACYVVVMKDDGEVSMEGDFDLCTPEFEAMIGTRETWTTRPAKVQAASCEGSPDCTASDDVDLVISISPHVE